MRFGAEWFRHNSDQHEVLHFGILKQSSTDTVNSKALESIVT